MLYNRKFVKSFPKSLFAYQTNHSGDSLEKYVYNSSSSSETLSSDLLSGSSLNSSTSSLTTSSENSSEFNEVEKVIEEYFIRKLARNSITKSQNISTPKNVNERIYRNNKSMNIEKYKYLKSSVFTPENVFWKNTIISSIEVGTQVSGSDFKNRILKFKAKRYTIKSKSSTISYLIEIWSSHKTFKSYLSKSVKHTNLNLIFQNSYIMISKNSKMLRYTNGCQQDNFIGLKHRFDEYFLQLNISKLSLSLDHFSPFKAILLLDKITSKILLFNDKARLLFKLKDSQFPLYFNTFLVKKFKYVHLVDYFFDMNGNLSYLPAKLVLCKDLFDFNFCVSLRLQTIDNNYNFENVVALVIVVIEPVITDYGISIQRDDNVIAFNDGFINMLKLHKMKTHNIFNTKFSDLCPSNHFIDNLSMKKEIKHNILNHMNQNPPFYFLSLLHSISQFEAAIYAKVYNMQTVNPFDIKNSFNLNFMWFFSNISFALTISLSGKIIDCDPYFNFLVGYSMQDLISIDINEIIKFNSFEFDPLLLLQKVNGKYETTLLHLNGSKIKSTAWITKQENDSGISFYILWFVMDNIENKYPCTMHLQSEIQVEGPINLKNLINEFGFSKINECKSNLYNHDPIITTNENLFNLKKKKSFSLPETSHYNDLKLSPWSLLTTIDIHGSNTSSGTSSHFKEILNIKDSDIFHNDYNILNIIGKGAFGFVRLATSLSSNEEFVVKFIRKSKLTIEHMVKVPIKDINKSNRRSKLINGYETISEDKILKTSGINKNETFILVPREIWMLCQLNHDNIVSLYDWYEGVDHYQMIMPKHGVGMDLFEFIDRSPILDEILVSHIFRQLANAVAYLHALMISHRDIKDENIILDDVFKIKLIDFGAAVKVEPGQKFKTFCGTMEFCSPEILLGEEYNCFHADIWSMGITLYTIMFGENPFYDFEETINAVLKPPKHISTNLFQLLSMLLEPNPLNRITAGNLTKHPWLNQRVDISHYVFEEIVPNSVFCGNMASDFRKYSVDSNGEMNKNESTSVIRKKESIKQESA